MEQGAKAMFAKTSISLGVLAAIGLFCIFIPPAIAKDRTVKETIGDLSPCLEGQVAKKQVDGSWACENDVDNDTSAASECDLGEVFVADGVGGGVC
jgi:hypothetical protein